MIGSTVLNCVRGRNVWVLALTNQKYFIQPCVFQRSYAKKGPSCVDCCKTPSQKKGRQLEKWDPVEGQPKSLNPQCMNAPLPPNNDLYRIKVPDVMVPQLPPSSAKPMLDCAKTLSPCASTGAPPPPPCPPPPPYKFPWIIPIVIGTLITMIGLLYKWWDYKEKQLKSAENKPIWRPRPPVRRPYHEKDLPPCVQYLIVGTGAAAWAAYRAIREHDDQHKVFFITKEDAYPYNLPPMSKYMWWNGLPPDIRHLNYLDEGKRKTMYNVECKHFMDPVKFYRKKTGPAVSIALGWCVSRVDADSHCVWVPTACGETPIYYERCLLATGSYAKNLRVFKNAPKPVREKATVLRTIRDLESAYRKAREAKSVTIVGGGPLGCELAYHMGRMQTHWFPPPEDPEYKQPEITFVYKGKGVLSHILPEYLGEWAAEKIKCENVTLVPRSQVYDAFETEDGRLELTLSSGKSVITDYVIVATGAAPRTEMARDSDLETDPINGGFLVNTELEARSHLWAAGDCASYYSQWKDTRMRMEHYLNAQEQGFIAGGNMTGYWTPCNMEPHYIVKLGNDIEMEVIGEVGACMSTVGIFKPCDKLSDPFGEEKEKKSGELDRPCFKKTHEYRNRYKRGMLFYLRDDSVVGIIFWNFPPAIEDRYEVTTEILRARPSYKDINLLAELLGFPDIQCYYITEEEREAAKACITKEASKWIEYADYDKMGALSKVEKPEIVLYENKPL